MSTGPCSSDLRARPRSAWREAGRGVRDLRPLLAFRAAGLRGRSRPVAVGAVLLLLALTAAAAALPAYLPDSAHRTEVLALMPTALVGVVVVAVISAAASGGGRELVPRDQAVAFPISPTTDHLGALLMAPLNIAWLLQAWTVLGATAYLTGPRAWLPLSQVLVLAWLVAATALAQVVGWAVEWVRRGPRGVLRIRLLLAATGLAAAYLVAADLLVPLLQHAPTAWVAIGVLRAAAGPDASVLAVLGSVLLLALIAVVAGAVLAGRVARRPAHDELRLETATYQPRPHPASDLAALLRTDRVGLWRSVSLRRGLTVLAVLPGVVALAGGMHWDMLAVLPGLVASGGALLFGVNSWCLDGRGALWRDSLPVDPRLAFVSRLLVLTEVLLAASAATVVLAALRAGLPTAAELSAVAAAAVVVVVQVVSASLRWSLRRPFPVDLRSSRATPAPPLVMVGYSARLALSTTLMGLFFALLSRGSWEWPLLLALPLVLFSAWRLSITARRWSDPLTRARVVVTVAS